MTRIDDAGYDIVMHIHDEVVLDAPIGYGSLEEVTAIMGQPIEWAPNLPLKAAGFETEFYKKD
jgi:DNA polymerase